MITPELKFGSELSPLHLCPGIVLGSTSSSVLQHGLTVSLSGVGDEQPWGDGPHLQVVLKQKCSREVISGYAAIVTWNMRARKGTD